MSVLIEAACLVVKELSVDLAFPGGADAFVARADAMESVRYVVRDGDLIAVSAFDPFHLEPLLAEVVEAGLVWVDEEGGGDCLFVDMELGTLGPCAWLTTEAHRHGYRVAALSADGAVPLATPVDWSPQQSWQLRRYDLRDTGPEHVLPLGQSENGEESWLDFDSGRVVTGPDERSPIVAVGHGEEPVLSLSATGTPALAAAQRLLGEKGVPYAIDTSTHELVVLFALDDAPDESAHADTTLGQPLHQPLLRIVLTAAPAHDSLTYVVTLPCTLSSRHAFPALTEQAMAADAGHVLDVDLDTGTMSTTVTVRRLRGERWEQAVERGFTHASGAGSRATRYLVGRPAFA